VPRSAEQDAVVQDGVGRMGMRWEFRRELNGKRGLGTKVLHLVHKYRSPNWDQKLSAGGLNGWEIEAREVA